MRRLLSIPIGILLLLLCCTYAASAQPLSLTLTISPHPSLRLADWQTQRETAQLLVINTGNEALTVKIQASLSLNGTEVAATRLEVLPPQTIPPFGQRTFFANDLFPAGAITFNNELKQSSVRSGILPEGTYELCITIVSVDGKTQLGNRCAPFFLAKFTMPALLQPADGAEIATGLEPTQLFTWSPMVPTPAAGVNYRVRLVEQLPSQDPKQALLNNRPIFERVTMTTTQLIWPQEVKLPNEGGTYIWSVQPEDAEGTPLIVPERFAEPFKLIVLPSQEQCVKFLSEITASKDSLLKKETAYWRTYLKTLRLKKEYDNALERADVYEIRKYESEVKKAEQETSLLVHEHEAIRKTFDDAIAAYKKCLGR